MKSLATVLTFFLSKLLSSVHFRLYTHLELTTFLPASLKITLYIPLSLNISIFFSMGTHHKSGYVIILQNVFKTQVSVSTI